MKNRQLSIGRMALPLLFFLLLSNIAVADSSIFQTNPSSMGCIDNTSAQYNWTVLNETGEWNYYSKNISCTQNCSTTLNDCRTDEPYQMYYFLTIIVSAFLIMFFGLFIGRRAVMLDFPIYGMMMLFFALMGGYFDVFSEMYRTMFLAMFLVPVGFFFYSLWVGVKTGSYRRGERGTGR